MSRLLTKFLLNAYTRLTVISLLCRGKKIRVGAGTVIFPGARIHPNTGRIVIGRGCRIFPGAVIRAWDGTIVIGDDVSVNEYAILHGQGRLLVGSNTRIASHAVIIPSNHGFDDPSELIRRQPVSSRGIRIGQDVWIGAGAKILEGVKLSDGSVIGAGAIVTRSTVKLGIYVGNPARLLRLRGEKKTLSDSN